MNDSSNNPFEQQWQDAFENASLTPSESVWEGIDARLPQATKPPKSFPTSGYIGIAFIGLLSSIGYLKTNYFNAKSVQPFTHKKDIIYPKNVQNEHQSTNSIQIIQKQHPFIKRNDTPDKESLVGSLLPINEPFIKKQTDTLSILQPMQAKSLSIDLPVKQLTQEEPYYIEQKQVNLPKKKESILKRVRISGGISINP